MADHFTQRCVLAANALNIRHPDLIKPKYIVSQGCSPVPSLALYCHTPCKPENDNGENNPFRNT
jgi:hypothetical protein